MPLTAPTRREGSLITVYAVHALYGGGLGGGGVGLGGCGLGRGGLGGGLGGAGLGGGGGLGGFGGGVGLVEGCVLVVHTLELHCAPHDAIW